MLTALNLCEHLARVAGLSFPVLRRRARICEEAGLFPKPDDDFAPTLDANHCWNFVLGLLAARRAEDTVTAVNEFGQLVPVEIEGVRSFAPGVPFGKIGAILIDYAREPGGRAMLRREIESLSCLRSASIARLVLRRGHGTFPHVQYYEPAGRGSEDTFRYTTMLSMEAAATSALLIGIADLLESLVPAAPATVEMRQWGNAAMGLSERQS